MQLSSEEIEKLREHKQRVIEYCSAYTEFGLLNQCNILKNAVNSIEFWSEETIIGEEVRDELKKNNRKSYKTSRRYNSTIKSN